MTGEVSSRDDDHDYRAMETALSETERGRWFLSEHARRHRGHDTQLLLDAVSRIETAVAERRLTFADPAQPLDASAETLSDVAHLVARARSDLAEAASDAASWSRQSEVASSDVLDATERIQEAAWNLRERGADPALCDLLDQRATEIYAACAAQERLAARSAAAVGALRAIELRLARRPGESDVVTAGPARDTSDRADAEPASAEPAFAERGGGREASAAFGPDDVAAFPRGPAAEQARVSRPGCRTDDDDSDPVELDRREHAAATSTHQMPADAFGPVQVYPATLDAIDALDAREKLRLFT